MQIGNHISCDLIEDLSGISSYLFPKTVMVLLSGNAGPKFALRGIWLQPNNDNHFNGHYVHSQKAHY